MSITATEQLWAGINSAYDDVCKECSENINERADIKLLLYDALHTHTLYIIQGKTKGSQTKRED